MSLPKPGAPVNPAAQREILINTLRLAVARSRMITNLLDSIGVALKHRQVDTEGALEWAKEEGVLDLLEFGPRKAGAQP
jgi:hypothetical protein